MRERGHSTGREVADTDIDRLEDSVPAASKGSFRMRWYQGEDRKQRNTRHLSRVDETRENDGTMSYICSCIYS